MNKELFLAFHGRVIDHLGYQMYQSPVAVISEMVSNSWDADAEEVFIDLPSVLDEHSEIRVVDNGKGMTFEECQSRFLNVGYDKREGNAEATTEEKHREVLGRKGIGKFAGFGVAKKILVDTTSKETGERTVFELILSELRGDVYLGQGQKPINVLNYEGPNEMGKLQSGTIIMLKELQLKRNISSSAFRRSMARRFLLHQRANDFKVVIDEVEITEDAELETIEYVFPRDYRTNELPAGLTVKSNGWGEEKIDEHHSIQWNIVFYKEPIDEEELQGISIFANGKLAQLPFFFNLTGGLGGQQGLEYISGRIEAGYIDHFDKDIIATERQRINWELDESQTLLTWGKSRIKSLLKIWVNRRTEGKIAELTSKLSPFGQRLEKLQRHERAIVEGTLKKLAQVPKLSRERFQELSNSVLTAWEGGRLKDLIFQMSEIDAMDEGQLLDILLEANIMTALHTAEAVKVKLDTIRGLEDQINKKQLENAVRDYIAENPWLLSPKWETFRKERSIDNIIQDAAGESGLEKEESWKKRVDLILSSGDQLLIVEFMRPGLTVDYDHIMRFQYYLTSIKTRLEANSGSIFKRIAGGYLVADNLVVNPTITSLLTNLATQGYFALDWQRFLREAEAQWKDFLVILAQRAPDDSRVKALVSAEEKLLDSKTGAGDPS